MENRGAKSCDPVSCLLLGLERAAWRLPYCLPAQMREGTFQLLWHWRDNAWISVLLRQNQITMRPQSLDSQEEAGTASWLLASFICTELVPLQHHCTIWALSNWLILSTLGIIRYNLVFCVRKQQKCSLYYPSLPQFISLERSLHSSGWVVWACQSTRCNFLCLICFHHHWRNKHQFDHWLQGS